MTFNIFNVLDLLQQVIDPMRTGSFGGSNSVVVFMHIAELSLFTYRYLAKLYK